MEKYINPNITIQNVEFSYKDEDMFYVKYLNDHPPLGHFQTAFEVMRKSDLETIPLNIKNISNKYSKWLNQSGPIQWINHKGYVVDMFDKIRKEIEKHYNCRLKKRDIIYLDPSFLNNLQTDPRAIYWIFDRLDIDCFMCYGDINVEFDSPNHFYIFFRKKLTKNPLSYFFSYVKVKYTASVEDRNLLLAIQLHRVDRFIKTIKDTCNDANGSKREPYVYSFKSYESGKVVIGFTGSQKGHGPHDEIRNYELTIKMSFFRRHGIDKDEDWYSEFYNELNMVVGVDYYDKNGILIEDTSHHITEDFLKIYIGSVFRGIRHITRRFPREDYHDVFFYYDTCEFYRRAEDYYMANILL